MLRARSLNVFCENTLTFFKMQSESPYGLPEFLAQVVLDLSVNGVYEQESEGPGNSSSIYAVA